MPRSNSVQYIDFPPVSLKVKILYGSGQAVDAVIQVVLNTFLLFYLTSVCGLNGAAAGSIFLISLVIDGLLDPFIGRLSDNWRSRWGRRLPFMAVAIPPMAIAVVLLFSLPANISTVALYLSVLLLNITLRVGLSVFALPHSALTAELTSDYSERSAISTFRALFIVIGTSAALLPAFTVVFSAPDALQSHSAYVSLGLLAAVLIAGFGLACILGIGRRIMLLPVPEDSDRHEPGFLADIFQLFRNPSFVPLFCGAVLVLIGQGVTNALNLHAYRYFWKLPSALMQLPLAALPVGMLLGTVTAGLLLKRIEKRDGVIGAVALLVIYQLVATLLVATGIVHPASLVSIGLVAISGLLFGACGAMCFVCFYSMIADAVDEHDHLFGVRREALYAAALMIGAKAATGLGAFFAGVGLQVVGFKMPPEGSMATVPDSMAAAVGLLWGPGGALFLLAAFPFFFRYRVDRVRHAEVLAGLALRHSATGKTQADARI